MFGQSSDREAQQPRPRTFGLQQHLPHDMGAAAAAGGSGSPAARRGGAAPADVYGAGRRHPDADAVRDRGRGGRGLMDTSGAGERSSPGGTGDESGSGRQNEDLHRASSAQPFADTLHWQAAAPVALAHKGGSSGYAASPSQQDLSMASASESRVTGASGSRVRSGARGVPSAVQPAQAQRAMHDNRAGDGNVRAFCCFAVYPMCVLCGQEVSFAMFTSVVSASRSTSGEMSVHTCRSAPPRSQTSRWRAPSRRIRWRRQTPCSVCSWHSKTWPRPTRRDSSRTSTPC